jgi:regulator of protease activity HflC (stomatin/prohibitin superfamily)
MNLFDLLAKLFEALFAWLPRPVLVPRTDVLVRWTMGRPPVALSGLCWTVPLFHYTEQFDQRMNAYNFEPQILWTKDGKEAAVGMVVLWHIADPLKLGETVFDAQAFVSKTAESVLPPLVGRFDLAELKQRAAGPTDSKWAFETLLERDLNAVFKPYGIAVESARLNFTSDRVRTFRMVGGGL